MTADKGIIIRNIYYMLVYAFQELRHNNYDDIAAEDFENILDLFAEILFKGVSFQLKRGIHKEYIPHVESISTVRGRIDINGSLSLRSQRKTKISCEFDDFSENNLHNSILKSTLRLLTVSRDVKKSRKNKLRSLLIFFSAVDECDLKSVRWSDIKYDRNSTTYRMLHHFCYFVVRRMLLTTESGPFRSVNFDEELMSRLFEKFVLSYYRRHYPEYSARSAKVEWNIDVEQSSASLLPEMRTDIMLIFGDRTLIIDTKYYTRSMQEYMGKITFHSHNIYQINSYVFHEDKTHSGCVDGMLLYAKTEEEITPDGQMRIPDGNTIFFRNLDLNQDFAHICKQLDNLIAGFV